MSEAGWLDGWLPRVLRPFAPVALRKRKTLCQPEAGGISQLPSSQGGEFSLKRQRLPSSANTKNKQVIETTNQEVNSIPQKISQDIDLRKQPPQHHRQAEKSLHSLQAPLSRATLRIPLTSVRAQAFSGGESDASFASVLSDGEAARTYKNLLDRKTRGAPNTWDASLIPGGQEPIRQKPQRQQYQRRVPPLPLQQSQQKLHHQAFPSLLPPSSLLLGRQTAPRTEKPPTRDPAAAPSAAVTRGLSATGESDTVNVTASGRARSVSSRSPSAPASGARLHPSASAHISSSTSVLPLLSLASASFPRKSHSTSELPSLSSVPQGFKGATAASSAYTWKSREEKKRYQGLPQQHGKQLQREGEAPPGGGRDLRHHRGLEGIAVSSTNSTGNPAGAEGMKMALGRSSSLPPADTSVAKQLFQLPLGDEGPHSIPARHDALADAPSGGAGGMASLEAAEGLFRSPKKRDETPLAENTGLVFGHRILRPLVSKDPTENYDAFLDILRHAKKHCEAETLELLMADKELLYYTRGSFHPKIALRQMQQQQQQQLHLQHQLHQQQMQEPQSQQHQLLAGARPAWAFPAALVASLNTQRSIDPFSVFGDAPPELVLHEVYGPEHYNAIGTRTRATHPVLTKLDKYLLAHPAANCSNSNSIVQQQQPPATLKEGGKRHLTTETWKNILLPALLSWWRLDTAVELDWRHDPLTAEDCSWYLQAVGATRDVTDVVTLKQPCFCPTPPPQRGWSWTDSRQLLRRRLAAGAIPVLGGRLSPWLSPSPPKRHREKASKTGRNPLSSPLQCSAIPASRLRASPAPAAISPITPGVRRRRQRKWAEISEALMGRGRTRKRSRFLSPNGSAPDGPSPNIPSAEAPALSPRPPVAAGAEGTDPIAAKTAGPSSATGEGLGVELGRLLADAQRRLNNLAERMRSRSRPPLNAGATPASSTDHNQRNFSSVKSSNTSYRSGGTGSSARTLSASGSLVGAHPRRCHKQELVLLDHNPIQTRGSARRAAATLGRIMQVDNASHGVGSYYSSSNLPLLGREGGSLLVAPLTGSATKTPNNAGCPKRAEAAKRQHREVKVPSGSSGKFLGEVVPFGDRLCHPICSSNTAIWEAP